MSANPNNITLALHDRQRFEAERVLYSRSFRDFIPAAWSQVESQAYVGGWHIDALADHLQAVSDGDIRNLIVNVPPRTTKSVTVSVLWNAWDWTRVPAKQFFFTSYSGPLAVRDAVKCRYLMQSDWYQSRWGHLWYFPPGENLKSRYTNSERGYRISSSVGGTTTGDGGDVIVVDDPHNLSDIYSAAMRTEVLDWWDVAMSNRLNDAKTGARVLVGQRSHEADLFGHVLERDHDFVHLCLPQEFDSSRRCTTSIGFVDPRKNDGDLLNPSRFGPEEVKEEKNTKTERDYQAQHQQRPLGATGLIIKRNWWRQWPHEKPPRCLFVLQFLDTAFEEKEENDYSARTTWGIFERQERYNAATGEYEPSEDVADRRLHCILLERWNERVGFPGLRQQVIAGVEKYNPDWVFVEKRASGHSLIQEMRKAKTSHGRIPIRAVKKNIDKVAAMHYASIVPEKRAAWYMDRAWSSSVIDQVCGFPMAEHDDLADTVSMCWAWLRRRNEIGFQDEDEDEEVDLFKPNKPIYG